MGLLDRIRTLAASAPADMAPPYGAQPPTEGGLEGILGHTAPAPSPAAVAPRVGALPYGQSGRANFYGLPEPDEQNARLIGPLGLQQFDIMYRTDPDVRRLVLMAWSPIVAGTWHVEPYGGDDATDQDRRIAETVWWLLTEHMSPGLIEHLQVLGPVLMRFGFAPFEQIWGSCTHQGKTLLGPRKLDLRLPRSVWRWWQDDYGELTHIGQILPNKPDVVIPASELNFYRLSPEGDNWVGTSLLRYAYKPWLMKDRLERIDAIGQERKAVGVPIVYPPETADDTQRSAVETILASLHVNDTGYLMMPGPHAQDLGEMAGQQGWRVEVITFDSSSGESIQRSLAYHRDGIASSFLGDFMQLGHHQVGARATADVQQDPFQTAVEGLAEAIKPPLQALIRRIVAVNWGEGAGCPTLNLALHDAASLSEISSYVQQLVTSGAMQADPELEDWLRERADMPPANADIRQAAQDAKMAGYQHPPAGQGAPAPGQNDNQSEEGTGAAGRSDPRRQLDDGERPPAWYEQLLSQGEISQALDEARDRFQAAGQPGADALAQQAAQRAASGRAAPANPPAELTSALTSELDRLYAIGYQTVEQELRAQHQRLTRLDSQDQPTGHGRDILAGAGTITVRRRKARRAGQVAARNVARRIASRIETAALNGADGRALQDAGADEAQRALKTEATITAQSALSAGRMDAADANRHLIAGAYYTSFLDERTCEPCQQADTGEMVALDSDDYAAQSPPNDSCAGGARCRCMWMYVLSDDPAALGV